MSESPAICIECLEVIDGKPWPCANCGQDLCGTDCNLHHDDTCPGIPDDDEDTTQDAPS